MAKTKHVVGGEEKEFEAIFDPNNGYWVECGSEKFLARDRGQAQRWLVRHGLPSRPAKDLLFLAKQETSS